jgi:sugar-specific transcriptional regulator TrmB
MKKIEELEKVINNLLSTLCHCKNKKCWFITKYKRPIKKLIREIKDEEKIL